MKPNSLVQKMAPRKAKRWLLLEAKWSVSNLYTLYQRCATLLVRVLCVRFASFVHWPARPRPLQTNSTHHTHIHSHTRTLTHTHTRQHAHPCTRGSRIALIRCESHSVRSRCPHSQTHLHTTSHTRSLTHTSRTSSLEIAAECSPLRPSDSCPPRCTLSAYATAAQFQSLLIQSE